MKEMVSWRGVAKKRRKQETAGSINQMIVHCCGHATIVARQQPLFGFIEAIPAARFDRSPFQAPRTARRSQLEGDRNGSFSNARFAARHRATKLHLATAHASPRITKRNSSDIPPATDRSIAPRAMRVLKVTTPDANHVRSDRVIFVRPALFALFSSREHAACHARAISGAIVHTPDETTSCAICRRGFDCRENRRMR